MARLSFEDKLEGDFRFIELCIRVGNRFLARGYYWEAAKLAQKNWIPDRKLIPKEAWVSAGLPTALIDVGLAEDRPDGIYLKGSEEHFAWWFAGREQRREAGRHSARRPRDEHGRLKPCLKPRFSPPGTTNYPALAGALPTTVGVEGQRGTNDSLAGSPTGANPLPLSLSRIIHSSINIKSKVADSSSHDEQGSLDLDKASLPTKRAPKDNAVPRAVAAFVEGWQRKMGTSARPDVRGRVLGQIKDLVAHRSIDDVLQLIATYFEIDDPWFVKKAYDFSTLNENVGKIAAWKANAVKTDKLESFDDFVKRTGG